MQVGCKGNRGWLHLAELQRKPIWLHTICLQIPVAWSLSSRWLQDQPELDAKYVYAGVHADGPTRVLCFSTTRDEYTRGTNEDSIALLTAKLKRLEHRLKVRVAKLVTLPAAVVYGLEMAMLKIRSVP